MPSGAVDANLAVFLATKDYANHTIAAYNLTIDGFYTYYEVTGITAAPVHRLCNEQSRPP